MLTSSDAQLLPQVQPIGPAAGRGGQAEGRGVALVVDLDGGLAVLERGDDGLLLAVGKRDGARGVFRRHGCDGGGREANELALDLRFGVSTIEHVSVDSVMMHATRADGSSLV